MVTIYVAIKVLCDALVESMISKKAKHIQDVYSYPIKPHTIDEVCDAIDDNGYTSIFGGHNNNALSIPNFSLLIAKVSYHPNLLLFAVELICFVLATVFFSIPSFSSSRVLLCILIPHSVYCLSLFIKKFHYNVQVATTFIDHNASNKLVEVSYIVYNYMLYKYLFLIAVQIILISISFSNI